MPDSPPALSLTVVPPGEYQQFADGLRDFLPHSYQVEDLVRGHLLYGQLDILRASLYAPANTRHRHHFAAVYPAGSSKEINSLTIYWDEHHLSDDDVYQLLLSLPVDSWRKPLMARQVPMHLQPSLDSIMLKLSDGILHLFSPIPLFVFTLAPEDTPPVPTLPEGYYYGTLDARFGKQTLDRWIIALTETVNCHSTCLDKLPSAAIFCKLKLKETFNATEEESEQEDELVSYVVYKHGADLGMTYTKEDHRRKGLGRAVTLMLAQKMHRDGLPVTVLIDEDNKLSKNMHASMGFKHYDDASNSLYFPKDFDIKNVYGYASLANGFPDSMKIWEKRWMTE